MRCLPTAPCFGGVAFSATLHLQGNELARLRPALIGNINQLYGQQLYIGCHDTPWQYTYTPNNYLPIDQLPQQKVLALLQQHPFVKLSKQLPIAQYQQLAPFAATTLELFLLCLR